MNRKQRVLPILKQHLHSILYSLICLTAATLFSLLFREVIPEGTSNISAIYLLAVIIISRCTVKYIYGIASGLISVIFINFFFSYPYYRINFTLDFIVNLAVMLAASVFVCAMKANLAKQENMIKERERQLSEFKIEKLRANLLRAVSHDIRTPLTGIMGNSSLILEKGSILSETEKTALVTNIYEDSSWLLNMVENLLTITRIKGDKLSITVNEEPVEEVVAEALQKVKKRYPDSELRAVVPDELIMLPMDAVLIEQVIINLISNAIEHSGSSEYIDIIVRDTPHAVIFTVRDYGGGISPRMQEGLFEGSAYSDSGVSDAYKGMGIGLSICKTIITAHHGTIIGRNHSDGAEFIFTLPKE
ncbi:MAG: DUF4118 domain-containing protein [Lachnospiraceae bacterium]|nr:DUF4118 domain-containing protein [Lachnospiraceae bacterium]